MKALKLLIIMGLCSPTLAVANSQADEWLAAINEVRSQAQICGKQRMPAAPPLTWDTKLAQAAQNHADDMAAKQYFQHDSLNGKTPFDRMKDVGYPLRTAAENIAAGNRDVYEALHSWLKSTGHCRNLMNPEMKDVGLGMATNLRSRYKIYWVMKLGATF